MSKPIVHGLIWSQLRDSEPHDFAHGGLIGPDDQPKPALRQFVAIRRTVSPK
jgi:hypothetical protein